MELYSLAYVSLKTKLASLAQLPIALLNFPRIYHPGIQQFHRCRTNHSLNAEKFRVILPHPRVYKWRMQTLDRTHNSWLFLLLFIMLAPWIQGFSHCLGLWTAFPSSFFRLQDGHLLFLKRFFFETKDGHLLICSIRGKKYKWHSCVAVNNRETKWTWQNEWCQVIWTTYAATKISTACSVEILAALLQLTRPSRRRTHWTVQFR